MNAARNYLIDALLSIAVLVSLVTVSHPGSGPARQLLHMKETAASALTSLPRLKYADTNLTCIRPGRTVKQIFRSLQ